eukprot:5459623-Pyramimonas_sp.AAC.1
MSVRARSRAKGGVFARRQHPDFPTVKRGDLLEPAVLGFPDFLHLQSVDALPRRLFSTYRRPAGGHCLFGSMRVVELGILVYYMGFVFAQLLKAGVSGPWSEKKNLTQQIMRSIAV